MTLPPSKVEAKSTKTKAKIRSKRKILQNCNIIKSPNHTYSIVSLLGSGGFGDVYKVTGDDNATVSFALKTESINVQKQMSRLKLEAFILEKCSKAEGKDHFLSLYDKGTTDHFKFIVMEAVGPSLESIRRNVLRGDFSKSTSLKLSEETLQCVISLHHLGFLHRDLKPANFSIGLPPDGVSRIILLDFGIALQFRTDCGILRPPRKKVPFLGTPRYCSRACHKQLEQSPKDDLEGWVYMILDLLDGQFLPWKREADRSGMLTKKEQLIEGAYDQSISKVCHSDFSRVIKYISQLEFGDSPDYSFVATILHQMASLLNVNSNDKFDWIDVIKGDELPAKGELSYSQTGSEEEEEGGGTKEKAKDTSTK